MIKNRRKMQWKPVALRGPGLLALFLAGQSAFAELIYHETFSGSGRSLNGTAPHTAPGAETWSSSDRWRDDGSKTVNGGGDASLPFVPAAGKVYQLSATLNPDTSNLSDWLALVFFQQSTELGTWVLNREKDSGPSVQSFLGPNTAGGQSHAPEPAKAGPIDFMIQLDTRAAPWTVTWHVDGERIRGPEALSDPPPTFGFVGFRAFNSATGRVRNFKLKRLAGSLMLYLGDVQISPDGLEDGGNFELAGTRFRVELSGDEPRQSLRFKSQRTGTVYGPFPYREDTIVRVGGVGLELRAEN
jgi:hypothetical protein